MSVQAGRSIGGDLSLAGGIVLLSYAVYRRDPVFMLGQAMGLVVYIRNLWLIHGSQGAV